MFIRNGFSLFHPVYASLSSSSMFTSGRHRPTKWRLGWSESLYTYYHASWSCGDLSTNSRLIGELFSIILFQSIIITIFTIILRLIISFLYDWGDEIISEITMTIFSLWDILPNTFFIWNWAKNFKIWLIKSNFPPFL